MFVVQDDKSELATVFMAVAESLDDHPFAYTTDSSVASEYKIEGEKIVLFKKVQFTIVLLVQTMISLFSINKI